MIAMPAVDLRDGACVQLVGGSYEREAVRVADPLGAARRWRALGFSALHLVDLDAATGRGSNDAVIERLVSDARGFTRSPDAVPSGNGVTTQVGGGVRSEGRVAALLRAGATRVVAGTRALEDAQWLRDVAGAHPGRVLVAVDVRGDRPVVRGWSRALPRDLDSVLAELDDLPLAGLLVTAVHVEGQLAGPDLRLVRRVVRASLHRVIAAGGITSLDDLRALAGEGAWGAVIGMALYTGDMDAAACAAEFGGEQ